MRRIWYSVAMSLDGYIAGPGGEYDWIPDEPTMDWNAYMKRFDTVLMGRVSYAAAASSGNSLPGMRTFVFSRTLRQEDHPGVTVVSDKVAEQVAALRKENGKDIWLFGGGGLFRSVLANGQVDMIEVGLVPALLGRGIPFLPPGLDGVVRLKLASTREYPSGIVMVTYEVRTA